MTNSTTKCRAKYFFLEFRPDYGYSVLQVLPNKTTHNKYKVTFNLLSKKLM